MIAIFVMVVKLNSFYKNALFVVGVSLFLFLYATKSFSQTAVGYSPQTLVDDPIAAALDSLINLNLFEKGYAKINYSKRFKLIRLSSAAAIGSSTNV